MFAIRYTFDLYCVTCSPAELNSRHIALSAQRVNCVFVLYDNERYTDNATFEIQYVVCIVNCTMNIQFNAC